LRPEPGPGAQRTVADALTGAKSAWSGRVGPLGGLLG
jgi:hypothetical protein